MVTGTDDRYKVTFYKVHTLSGESSNLPRKIHVLTGSDHNAFSQCCTKHWHKSNKMGVSHGTPSQKVHPTKFTPGSNWRRRVLLRNKSGVCDFYFPSQAKITPLTQNKPRRILLGVYFAYAYFPPPPKSYVLHVTERVVKLLAKSVALD